MNTDSRPSRVNVLGVGIDPLRLSDLLAKVSLLAQAAGRHRVMYANIHVLNTAARDAGLRRILNAAEVMYCDGEGVRRAARWLGGSLPERMTGADWIYPACKKWEEDGLSPFLLGGAEGVAERAAARLREQFPALKIAGTHSGFFGDDETTVEEINAASPDLLLVGMGTPAQEQWVEANFARLNVPVVWVVGALMDFVSGVTPRAPRWMLAHGLEWLGRLIIEPRRLWRRYLFGNPRFVWSVALQRWGLRHYE